MNYIKDILFLAVMLFSLSASSQTLDFINTEANVIIMNGDNWDTLRKDLKNMRPWTDDKFSILHIGDSHIQADFMTSVVRRALQEKYGNGGRGLIAALHMAGTNEPVDYRMTADTVAAQKNRLLKRPWTLNMGVTGVASKFAEGEREFCIETKYEGDEFSNLTLLHGESSRFTIAGVGDFIIEGKRLNSKATQYTLPRTTDSVRLTVDCDSEIYGAYLTNSKKGLIYNAIGNNGACFSNYLQIDGFAKDTQMFGAKLIVLSMGTNEAFGNLTEAALYDNIDKLIERLRQANPKAKFLLLTPMECQKRVTRTVKERVRVRRKKYKTVTKTISSFAINERVKYMRNTIMRYGRENHVPVWDMYEIAGGDGASNSWLVTELMNPRDHVHCLKSGYELQGSLLSDALLDVLE